MRRRGFTLAETLVSLCITALVVLFVASLFPALKNGVAQSHLPNAALAQARLYMEQVRTMPFGKIDSSLNRSNVTAYLAWVTGGNQLLTVSTYDFTVTSTDANRKVLTMTTRWTDGNGSHSTTLETVVVRM